MKKARAKKIFKWSAYLALFLALAALSVWALGVFYARPALETKIKNAFRKATSDRYILSFDELSLDYTSRGVSISNLVIRPNGDSLYALRENGLLELTCSQASVGGIRFWKTFFGKKFSAEELLLDTPKLTVWNKNGIKSENRALERKKNIGQLDLGKIRIVNAQASIRDKETNNFLFGCKTLNLFVDEFGLTEDLIPLYRHFTLESFDNSLSVFNGREFKVAKLFLTGGPEYTGLSANGFDISSIDSSLHRALRIPDEITFSLDGISVESESLANLAEQIIRGNTQDIHIMKLLLIQPNVQVKTSLRAEEKSLEAGEKINRVAHKLALPSVDQIGILNGRFNWQENGTERPLLDIRHIRVMATGVRPRMEEKIPVVFNTAEIMTGDIGFTYPGSQYSFYSGSVQYRSVTDSLEIGGLRILPHQSVDSFYLDKKWRQDRFEFYCDTVHVKNLHLSDFVFRHRFTPELIRFKTPEIMVYTDKRLNHNPQVKKPFPLERLRSVEGDFDIGRIVFENGKASYSEKVPNSPGIGTLHMDRAYLELSGIKNDPQPSDTAHLLYSCSFGQGSYGEIKLDIPLFGKDEIQYARGSIKNLPFKQLNSITENTVFMGFASGQLDSCWFRFKAVNGKSEGNSVFFYNNLKVKLYKPVEVPAYKTVVLLHKAFMSLAANFLINKSNPTAEGYSLPGNLSFERESVKGPLNFWIKTIMTGLMNTAIEDISELKDLQEEIKSLKSSSKTGLLSKMKADPAKKNARKQARDAKKDLRNEGGTK